MEEQRLQQLLSQSRAAFAVGRNILVCTALSMAIGIVLLLAVDAVSRKDLVMPWLAFLVIGNIGAFIVHQELKVQRILGRRLQAIARAREAQECDAPPTDAD